ncbi:uncharacterized protein [Typha angustifolia]|uniref:uncharacterized protein n=1 Tax=Typha angustifolia TaxID=59011 RepID=UPI003C306161
MGTKLEGKSYLPGYLEMRDLNVNVSSTWSGYYEENMLSGPPFGGFMARPTYGSQYDREMLKQMMLEHEATFRKQVYELHRLYGIQKDLMQEFQSKELPRYSIPPDTLQSNSFMFQMPSEGTKKIWQMPFLRTTYESSHIAGRVEMKPLLNFLKEGSVQSSPNTASSKDGLQRSKKMFDLQLPADEYIENEDVERSGKKNAAESSFKPADPLDISCNTNPGSDVKLTRATSESPSCREDSWVSDKQRQNILRSHKVVDLNEPTTGTSCKGAADSASTDLLRLRNCNKEDHCHHLPTTSNTRSFDSKGGFFKFVHADERTSSNFFNANERMKRVMPTSNKENGKSVCSLKFSTLESCNGALGRSSEQVDMKSDRSETMEWFMRKTDGIKTSGRNYISSSKNSGQADLPMPASFSILQMDHPGDAFPFVPSSAKTGSSSSISQIPLAVQAHPCFNVLPTVNFQRSTNITIQNTESAIQKWKTNGNLTLDPGSQSEAPYINGFCQSIPGQASVSHLQHPSMMCSDLDNNSSSNSPYGNFGGRCPEGLQHAHSKCLKNVNLNQALTDGILEGQQDKDTVSFECKGEETGVGISWLRTKGAVNESVDMKSSQTAFSFTHGNSQLVSSSSRVGQESESKHGKDFEVSEDTAARILGFSVCDKIQKSTTHSPISHQRKPLIDINKQIEKEGLCYTNITCDLQVASSDKESQSLIAGWAIGKNSKILRDYIDLNDALPFIDNSELSELPSEGEVPSKLSVPSVCVKTTSEIDLDLEAHIFEAEGIVNFQKESVLSEKQESSQEKDCCHDSFAIAAAKNILAMSMDTRACLDRITSHPASPPPCDTLHWFAEVAMSTENPGVLMMDLGVTESLDDGLDLFESMTLLLEETKIDDNCCSEKVIDNRKEEEIGAASLLLTKPRRGQARRRRQRRDFQKDILPGLASLSRHEVSEDLQTIGGLLKASGRSWQTSLTRRTGRNGSQANGRRQLRSLAVAVPEIQVNSPPLHSISTDMDTDGRSMIGWGRTTRRCRRPRCPSGNAPAPVA